MNKLIEAIKEDYDEHPVQTVFVHGLIILIAIPAVILMGAFLWYGVFTLLLG